MAEMYCVNCESIDEPKAGRSTFVLLLLLFIGIVPGIIYYLLTKSEKTCRSCGSTQVVHLNSAIAKKAIQMQKQQFEQN